MANQIDVKLVGLFRRYEPFELAMGAISADFRTDETKAPTHAVDVCIYRDRRSTAIEKQDTGSRFRPDAGKAGQVAACLGERELDQEIKAQSAVIALDLFQHTLDSTSLDSG